MAASDRAATNQQLGVYEQQLWRWRHLFGNLRCSRSGSALPSLALPGRQPLLRARSGGWRATVLRRSACGWQNASMKIFYDYTSRRKRPCSAGLYDYSLIRSPPTLFLFCARRVATCANICHSGGVLWPVFVRVKQ